MQQSHKDRNVSENSVFIFWICEDCERFSSRAIFERKIFERFSSRAVFEPKIFERFSSRATFERLFFRACSSHARACNGLLTSLLDFQAYKWRCKNYRPLFSFVQKNEPHEFGIRIKLLCWLSFPILPCFRGDLRTLFPTTTIISPHKKEGKKTRLYENNFFHKLYA